MTPIATRRGLRAASVLAILSFLSVVVPSGAVAQIGSATDILTGTVLNRAGEPMEDVNIEATSLETQVTRRARTDSRGRFTILFTDGGGQYRITARTVGMVPRTELLQRFADEDRLIWNVTLDPGEITLAPIIVRSGPQPVRAPEGPTPGSLERVLGTEQLARLPIELTDINLLASLVPGVVMLDATDSTGTAFSVAGLGSDANAVTLDGLLFGEASIPQEGLRNTRVITSTYDVSRGQFSGGMIASTTRSGSNMVQGSSGYSLRDDALAITEDTSAFASGFTQNVFSGGVGGPLVRNRLFVFGSLQARLRSDPQQNLLSADGADYTRLGVSPDSVARFLAIVQGLGVSPTSVTNVDSRSNNNLSGLLRADYLVSNAHTVTLRGDWRGRTQDPARLGATALPQTGGDMASTGGGAMLTLTSRFGATIINEGRVYYQTSRNDSDPFSLLPQGRVQVASVLPDSAIGVTTLVFGGNTSLPTRARSHSLEATNELSWLPGTGAHRLKFGVSYLREHADNLLGGNQLGNYTYNSLSDLENGLPALYRRTLQVSPRVSNGQRWSAYAGDVWLVRRPFQLTYGVRLEGSSFSSPPTYNPAVDAAFGRRTDALPSEVHLSPRAGFTWSIGGSQFVRGRMPTPPKLVVRGGIGEFRSQPPTSLVAQAQSATGLSQSTGEIVCIGTAVPTPDWGGYVGDPATIPDACTAVGAPPPGGTSAPRAVTLLAPGFQAPRAWRGSLGLERRLTQLFRLTTDFSVSRGVAQNGMFDLNLASAPKFTLPGEAGRPVYVATADIAPTTGAARFAASRADTTFGQVFEARSVLASQSEQLTVGVGGIFGRGIIANLSWTWQHTRDQQSGGRGGNTAGDPNRVEWATSGYERRHSFLATVTYPIGRTMEFTTIGRLSSGTPFTPLVGGDVNGDGSASNDRAFVFAGGTATPEAAAMSRLLAGASDNVRSCLTSQVGRIAARNSCRGPWQTSLEFQWNWRPSALGLNRRATFSLVTQNFLRGVDELVHGADGAHGWGLNARPDARLLYVTGFDPATSTYRYNVNERFGATGGTATAFRPPFQVGINVRVSFGPDRRQAAMDAMRGGGGRGPGGFRGDGGGFGGGGVGDGVRRNFSPEQIIARVDSAIPNPAAVVLDLRDSLHLTASQVRLLEPVRDSLERRRRVRLDSMRATIARGGDQFRMMQTLLPVFTEARDQAVAAVTDVRSILTPEQWLLVPENVKNLTAQRGFGPGGRGPGGEGRPRP